MNFHSDKPWNPFGNVGVQDYAYRTDLTVTTNSSLISSTLNKLKTLDGGDAKNSQLEALLQASVRDEPGWTSSSRRIVVIVTKSVYHDRESSANLTDNNGDSTLGAFENYPTRAQVANALLNRNVYPVFICLDSVSSYYNTLVNSLGFGSVITFTKNKVSK